ncbi:hypothetical protein ACRAWD_29240 [Caulobacter segnis]
MIRAAAGDEAERPDRPTAARPAVQRDGLGRRRPAPGRRSARGRRRRPRDQGRTDRP